MIFISYTWIFSHLVLSSNYILSLQVDYNLLVGCFLGLFVAIFIPIFIFFDSPLVVGLTFQWPENHLGNWLNIFNETVHKPHMENDCPSASVARSAL